MTALTIKYNLCTLGMHYVLSRFSHVWLFATLWTIAHQAPLSMGFSRQEYWSGWVAISFSKGFSRPRSRTRVSYILALAGKFFSTRTAWEAPPPQPPTHTRNEWTQILFLQLNNTVVIEWRGWEAYAPVDRGRVRIQSLPSDTQPWILCLGRSQVIEIRARSHSQHCACSGSFSWLGGTFKIDFLISILFQKQ